MEIGADLGTHVGDYNSALPLRGLVDELAIYHRELSADEIARHAKAVEPDTASRSGLVASYSFDQGGAADRSDHANNGTLEGVAVVAGKFGKALRLSGATRGPDDFVVKYRWTRDLPVLGRALVLTNGTIFVAGPPDLVDEPEALRQIDDPEVQSQLARQEAAIEGTQGGTLWAIATSDGSQLARYPLDSPPIFDGLAAAQGRLYMSASDGHVVCLTGRQPAVRLGIERFSVTK